MWRNGWLGGLSGVLLSSRCRSSSGAAAAYSPQWCRSSGRGSLANERHLAWTDELPCCCWAWPHGKASIFGHSLVFHFSMTVVTWTNFHISCTSYSAPPTLTVQSTFWKYIDNIQSCRTHSLNILLFPMYVCEGQVTHTHTPLWRIFFCEDNKQKEWIHDLSWITREHCIANCLVTNV